MLISNVTGKTIEECKPFEQYWSYTSLDDVVDRIMMPPVETKKISDSELREKLETMFEKIVIMKPAKLDRVMEELERETGIDNVSDYIFWPSMIEGLGKNANKETIINKIIADRK